MDTRPLRIFLIGTSLAIGAVVGLAPASEAANSGYEPVAPPVTIGEIDPCALIDCFEVPEVVEIDPCLVIDCIDVPEVVEIDPCILTPELCPPDDPSGDPTDDPTEDPHEDPQEDPHDKPQPKTPRPSKNPDVVRSTPSFTG